MSRQKINLFNTAKDINWRASLVLDEGEPKDFYESVKSIEMPAISFSYQETSFGNQQVKIYSNFPKYNDINIEFLVDEQYRIVDELYSWAFKQSETSGFLKASLVVQLLDSYQNPVFEASFRNLQISDLDAMPYTTDSEVNELNIGATFSYNGVDYKKI